MANNDQQYQVNLRFGWTALVVFALLGLILESLHLVKLPFYFEMHIRRELWTLAHAHGTLLALINIVFGLYAQSGIPTESSRTRASLALRTAAILMPAGFFFGGIGNAETDPSIAIILVPVGAILLLYGAGVAALACWRPVNKAS